MAIDKKQAVGSNFDLQKMHIARDKTFEAVHAIAQQITVGMSETDARELAKDILVEMGMDRIWHQLLVRFGTNTLKKFNEPSEGNPILQTNDIFFIDLEFLRYTYDLLKNVGLRRHHLRDPSRRLLLYQ